MKSERTWNVYVIQHSHTDIGYTERQDKIIRYHYDFIRQAIDILDEIHGNGEAPEGFVWQCENYWQIFLSQFTWSWNDLMFGLTFTKTSSIRPIMASISMMGRNNAPALFLACIVASIPTIILFVFLQDNFEAGMAYTSK